MPSISRLWKAAIDRQFRAAEAAFGGIDVAHGKAVVAGMKADRQVEFLRHLVEPEEIRIGEAHFGFQAAHEYAAGAVLLAEGDFLARLLHGAQGRHHHPAQAALALLSRCRRASDCSCGRARFRRWGPASRRAGKRSDRAPARRYRARPYDSRRARTSRISRDTSEVLEPILCSLGCSRPSMIQNSFCDAAFVAAGVFAFDLAHDARAEMAVFRIDVIEGRHRLDDMRVGIDGSHGYSSKWRGNITASCGRNGVATTGTGPARMRRCVSLFRLQDGLEEGAELWAHADGEAGDQCGQQPAAGIGAGNAADFAAQFAADFGGSLTFFQRRNVSRPRGAGAGATRAAQFPSAGLRAAITTTAGDGGGSRRHEHVQEARDRWHRRKTRAQCMPATNPITSNASATAIRAMKRLSTRCYLRPPPTIRPNSMPATNTAIGRADRAIFHFFDDRLGRAFGVGPAALGGFTDAVRRFRPAGFGAVLENVGDFGEVVAQIAQFGCGAGQRPKPNSSQLPISRHGFPLAEALGAGIWR